MCFHARFGAYYKTRVPKFGRDLAYCPFSAELLVAASAPEVRRLAGRLPRCRAVCAALHPKI